MPRYFKRMKIMIAVSLAMLWTVAVALAQSQAATETIYTMGGPDSPSVPKCPGISPDYTAEAKQAKVQGNVVLDSIIHADGSVTVSSMTSDVAFGLPEQAKKAAEQVKCTPGQLNGKPVSISLKITVNFRLYN